MLMVKFSNHGSRMRAVYSAESTSPLSVVKTGEEDQFKYIQASKESVLLENLIKRALDGEEDVLNQTHGMYGDFTNMPDNLCDVMKAYQRGVDAFMRLPESITGTFGSIGDLLDALGSGEFEKRLKELNPLPEDNEESGDVNE